MITAMPGGKMKKIVIFILMDVFAGCLFAAPVKPYEYFTLDPAGTAVKAGTVLKLAAAVKCQDGYELKGISASVTRRMAPASFFALKNINIKRYDKANPPKDSQYDAVLFYNKILPRAVSNGDVALEFNTAGLTPGDYAIAFRGYFIKKGEKAVYANIFLALTVGE